MVCNCFTEMLSHWLKHSTSPPMGSMLKEALKSPAIDRLDIAKKIKGDIKTDTDTNSTSQGWNVLQTYCISYC